MPEVESERMSRWCCFRNAGACAELSSNEFELVGEENGEENREGPIGRGDNLGAQVTLLSEDMGTEFWSWHSCEAVETG